MIVSIILMIVVLSTTPKYGSMPEIVLTLHTVYSILIVVCGLLKVELNPTGVISMDTVLAYSLGLIALGALIGHTGDTTTEIVVNIVLVIMSILYMPHVLFGC